MAAMGQCMHGWRDDDELFDLEVYFDIDGLQAKAVAQKLNKKYDHGRTAQSCHARYAKIIRESKKAAS